MDPEIIAQMNRVFPGQSGLKALFRVALMATSILAAPCTAGQPASSAPPAVGVVTVERRPMTDSDRVNRRVQAINSINIVSRVTACLEKQILVESSHVENDDRLYTLLRPPIRAAVDL